MLRVACALALSALSAASSPGQMSLTLTDGTTTRGSLGGIAADGTWTWEGSGGSTKIPPSRIVGLDAGEGAVPPLDDAFRIELLTGDALVGRIEDGSSDDVRIRGAAFGDVTFSLDDVTAIWNLQFPRAPESLPPPQGGAETLYVERDGRIDYVPGTLEKIGKNQVTFSIRAGGARVFSFDRDRVVAVRSQAPGGTKPRGKDASILRLKDGSRLSGVLRPSDGATIAMKLATGQQVAVDARFVKSLLVVNDSLRYLSDLDPSGYSETPLIGGSVPQGLHRDRGLTSGQPLRVGRQTFSKGIMMPAKSRATYRLDGPYSRFVASVGVDGAGTGPGASGSVRASVLADGKAVWTSGVLKAGRPPEPIDLPLAGARELVIEVDFGDSFDAGARAVLGNAMLVR